MNIKKNLGQRFIIATVVFLSTVGSLPAGELGHFNPGVPNIRDFFVPTPGFYYIQYNFYYTSDIYKNRHGRSVKSVGSGLAAIDIDVDLDLFVIVPMLTWVSPWEVLGARWGAYVAPVFGNTSFGAALDTEIGRGRHIKESQFAPGDLYLQPIWLGWPLRHWDFVLGYGLYAPVGRYENGAVDNVGLGFWTNQFQGAVAWYPWENRGTAVTAAVTYEINSKKEKTDITPGSHLTLNWGVSQYLPLSGEDLLLEAGLLGYDQWKVTDDTGDDLLLESARDQIHAAGVQIGLTYAPWPAYLTFKYLAEYSARARFEGNVFNLSFLIKF
ncbi:MAG: transporter [PVC group bacterium]